MGESKKKGKVDEEGMFGVRRFACDISEWITKIASTSD